MQPPAQHDSLRRLASPPAATAPVVSAAEIGRLHGHILGWYADHGRDLPWRRTADPYAILVSEVMLQQTQVPRVVPKYDAFLAAFPALEDLAAAPVASVLALWRGLGYNNRAARLRQCARSVCAAAGGRPAALPRRLEALRALPGVGPYTARAVLVFAHNDDVAAVDANVRRVLTHELALPHDLPVRSLQKLAEHVLPRGRSRDWHNALMDYGSAVLTSRATRIAPCTRQGAFEGSRRWYRSRMLTLLLDGGPRSLGELARELEVSPREAETLATLLERDGLLRRDDGVVEVAVIYDVDVVAVPAQAVVALRERGPLTGIGSRMRRLRVLVSQAGLAPSGPMMARFYEDDPRADQASTTTSASPSPRAPTAPCPTPWARRVANGCRCTTRSRWSTRVHATRWTTPSRLSTKPWRPSATRAAARSPRCTRWGRPRACPPPDSSPGCASRTPADPAQVLNIVSRKTSSPRASTACLRLAGM